MTSQRSHRNRRARTSVLLITLALLLLGAAAPAVALAGSISGTVTDAVTKAPIEGLELCASPEDGNLGNCATTNANGEYTITDLLVNDYRVILYGEPLGYQWQVYNEALLGYFDDRVAVGSEPVTGIDVEMHPFGRIEGVVSEAGTGLPAGGIRVCAWDVTGYRGGDCAHTSADGTYTIPEVRPGEYTIEFLSTGNLLSQAWRHEGKENWWEGAPLSVALSEVVAGIDAALTPGGRVEGTVRLAGSAQPVQGAFVCALLLPSEQESRCALPNPEGDYSLQGLATGEYQIEFKPFSGTLQIQYWDHQTNIADARSLSLTAGTTTTGIDADLVATSEPEQSPPATDTTAAANRSPLTRPAQPGLSTRPSRDLPKPSSARSPLRCRKGFHRKLVGGKVRCVRKRGRHHHVSLDLGADLQRPVESSMGRSGARSLRLRRVPAPDNRI